ncbi:MAG: hypothetical protein AAB074_05450 [Planctomycetota bacterium]
MVKKKAKPAGGAAVANAVAAEMRKRDRRAWTIVEYAGADWAHGFCKGDRCGAWKTSAGKLAKVKPPDLLEVPYAQFCVEGTRVLVESALRHGSGQGETFEVCKTRSVVSLSATSDGVKWRVGR